MSAPCQSCGQAEAEYRVQITSQRGQYYDYDVCLECIGLPCQGDEMTVTPLVDQSLPLSVA